MIVFGSCKISQKNKNFTPSSSIKTLNFKTFILTNWRIYEVSKSLADYTTPTVLLGVKSYHLWKLLNCQPRSIRPLSDVSVPECKLSCPAPHKPVHIRHRQKEWAIPDILAPCHRQDDQRWGTTQGAALFPEWPWLRRWRLLRFCQPGTGMPSPARQWRYPSNELDMAFGHGHLFTLNNLIHPFDDFGVF